MSGCRGLAGLIFGHKFTPRFDTGMSTMTSVKNCSMYDAAMLIEASSPKSYVYDVCVRCGATISRAPAQEPGERT